VKVFAAVAGGRLMGYYFFGVFGKISVYMLSFEFESHFQRFKYSNFVTTQISCILLQIQVSIILNFRSRWWLENMHVNCVHVFVNEDVTKLLTNLYEQP